MEWNPISQLPMQPDASVTFESKSYLVTDGEIVAVGDFARGGGAQFGKQWAAWSMYGGIQPGYITHWAELPKPPAM